jgi:hypothetical protein
VGWAVVKAVPLSLLALLLVAGFLPFASVYAQSTQNREPVALGLAVVPTTLPANSRIFPALVVSLMDGNNQPTLSLSNVVVYLSSSNQSIAGVPSVVTLQAGRTFLQGNVNTTMSAGQTTLAAASSGFSSNSVTLRTVKPVVGPASLNLYASPTRSAQALVGDDGVFAVQLVNTNGRAATSGKDTDLVITSSNSSLISGPISVTIPAGANLAYGTVKARVAGTTTLTALAPQLATGEATFTVAPVLRTFTVTVTPSLVHVGDTASVVVSAHVLGMPVPRLNVSLSTFLGMVVPQKVVTDASGQATAKYLAQAPGPATIVALASTSYLGQVNASAVVIIGGEFTTSSPPGPADFVYTYIPVIVAGVVVVLAYLVIRRTLGKRRRSPEDEFAAPEPKT